MKTIITEKRKFNTVTAKHLKMPSTKIPMPYSILDIEDVKAMQLGVEYYVFTLSYFFSLKEISHIYKCFNLNQYKNKNMTNRYPFIMSKLNKNKYYLDIRNNFKMEEYSFYIDGYNKDLFEFYNNSFVIFVSKGGADIIWDMYRKLISNIDDDDINAIDFRENGIDFARFV